MSENSNNSFDSKNKRRWRNSEAELEELLFQVFGGKENMEKEKASQGQGRSEIPDVKFENPNANNNIKKAAVSKKSSVKVNNVKNNNKNKSLNKKTQNSQTKKAAGAATSKASVGSPTAKRKQPVRSNKTQTKPNSAAKGEGKKKKQTKLEQKISKLTGKKRVAAILGVFFGILLILLLIVVGLFFFYTSLFGKYRGEKNEGEYLYNSSDYVSEADTMTPEEAEAALKKQLEGASTDLMKDKDVMNILLIGEDLRDTDNEERGNTDVMLMVSLNTKQKTITMTSFMRDAWVYIDGYGMAKLNAAYWRDGPELLKSTIEKYYGVAIDRYVIVNFKSFIDIIDTLGGIKMDVRDDEAEGMKKPMAEQNNILGNKKGTDYLKKGGEKLLLNGNQALAYARLRYVGNADYERTERQRKVITEIINESKSMSLIELNDLAKRIFPQVKLDITQGEMFSMLLNIFDYMDYDIQELRIPSDGMFTEDVIGGLSVLSPDFSANKDLIIKTIYGSEDESGADDSDAANDSSEAKAANNQTPVTDYNGYNN